MKKHTIIGTAGHIDHGKTSLIKALTGIDADRLKEEKERGITIDIGFAYWKDNVTIIDVPGHEKFIRNMVAGVSTIDFFILVIAADDGIMPQTMEHLDILNFFNICDGIVVINKIDLVDNEWLELVIEEVKGLLGKYSLEKLPIIDVSSINGKNIDVLREYIESKVAAKEEKETGKPFRLFVDRSFTIKGFGTVVTGTVLGGMLKKGDEVEIYPQKLKTKVRGIQTHIQDTAQVQIGERAAVNLQGVSKTNVIRGDVLSHVNALTPVTEFIGIMRTVSKIPVKIFNRSRVKVYVGTAERIGRIFWFEKKKILEENQLYHVRIKLESPLSAVRNDAFLIRLHSPLITLAGGSISDINPAKISAKENQWKPHFDLMSSADIEKVIEQIIRNQVYSPISITSIMHKVFEEIELIKKNLKLLLEKNKIQLIEIKGQEHYLHEDNFQKFTEEIKNYLNTFHDQNPTKLGLNRQELIKGLKQSWLSVELIDKVLQKLIQKKLIKFSHDLYSSFDFKVKVSRDTDRTSNEILEKIKVARFAPPALEELSESLGMPANEIKTLVLILTKENKLILVDRKFYLHYETWNDLLSYLKNIFKTQAELPVPALKEFIQTSRKFAIPLFEYLDSEGYTIRKGDIRIQGPLLTL